MDDNSILARLLTGFAVRAIGAGLAIYVGLTVYHYVTGVFAQVQTALPL